MFKKYLTLLLAFLVMNLFFSVSTFAQTQNDNDNKLIANVKNMVARVGTEPNRKIKITLKDGTKLKGYITEIKNDNFSLLDSKSSNVTAIQYSNVIEAKRDGLSKLATIAITTGVILGTLIGLSAIAVASGID